MDETFTIQITTDASKFRPCIAMMIQSDPWLRMQLNHQQCQQAFEGPCKEVYVVEDPHDEIVGFVILQVGGSFKGYIQTLCVEKDHRGKGIGKMLMNFCEERISRISPNIFICVSSFNLGALRLYEGLGFKQIGKLENFVKEGFTELLLRKTSGPIYP